MWPRFATHDQLNRCLAHAVSIGQCADIYTVCTLLADASHIIVSQFCIAVLLTFRCLFGVLLACGAALSRHIGHIVVMGAKKQVIGANTCRVIATMQHPQLTGNGAVMKFPRKPMSVYRSVRSLETTVPIRSATFPQPTRFGFGNSQPEPLFRSADPPKMAACRRVVWAGMPTMFTECGRLAHVDTSLLGVGHATGCYQQRGGFVVSTLYHIWRPDAI